MPTWKNRAARWPPRAATPRARRNYPRRGPVIVNVNPTPDPVDADLPLCWRGHPKKGWRKDRHGKPTRYCIRCRDDCAADRAAGRPRQRPPRPPRPLVGGLAPNFWAKVDKTSPDGCWIWTGGATNNYGVFTLKENGRFVKRYVHRLVYVGFIGPIPPKLQVDHRCHTRECGKTDDCPHRRCVNPDHLKAVTAMKNLQRAKGFTDTHCTRGHAYDGPRRRGSRYRTCRVCQRASHLRSASRWRAAGFKRAQGRGWVPIASPAT